MLENSTINIKLKLSALRASRISLYIWRLYWTLCSR